jgi:hypothetical protein
MINLFKIKTVLSYFLVFFSVFILVLGVPSFIVLCPFIYFNEASNVDSSLVNDDFFYSNVFDFLVYQKSLDSTFTSDEASHMHDVRFLFNLFRFLSLFFLLLIFCYIFLIFKINKSEKKSVFDNKIFLFELNFFLKKIKLSIFLSLGFFVLLLFFVFVDFTSSFNVFHKLFFPQGNWMFSIDSLLINLFPLSFFIGIAKKVFLFSSLFSVLFLGFILLFEKKFLRKK